MNKLFLDPSMFPSTLQTNLHNFSNSLKWEWTDINLKIQSQNRSFVQSFHPSYEVPKMQVNLCRDILFDAKKGFFWHKSWILPTLTVTLEMPPDFDLDNIYLEIFATIENENENGSPSFERELLDVGMSGCNKMPLKKGKSNNLIEYKFNALKFDSTSYNSEKKKFFIVVALYKKCDKKAEYQILKCKSSPPVYVDSRKTASEPNSKEETYLKVYDPEMNDRIFYKKKQGDPHSTNNVISNTMDGLFSYYTAPNIRNKIKHPFFIALRFSECCSLYYNKNKINEPTLKDSILSILRILNNFEFPSLNKKQKKRKHNSALNAKEEKILILQIKSLDHSYLDKKIAELLYKFENQPVSLVFNSEEIPEYFEKLTNIEEIKEIYKEVYENCFKPSNSSLKSSHLLKPMDDFIEKKVKIEKDREFSQSSLKQESVSFPEKVPTSPLTFPNTFNPLNDNEIFLKAMNNMQLYSLAAAQSNEFNQQMMNFVKLFANYPYPPPFINWHFDKFIANSNMAAAFMENQSKNFPFGAIPNDNRK